jgi:hypothetical protein
MKQAIVVVSAEAAVVALGVAMIVEAMLRPGWPSLVPPLMLVYGLLFLGAGLWARSRLRRGSAPWLARYVACWALPLLTLGFVVWFAGTGVTSRVSHDMFWSYGEPPTNAEGQTHLILTFQSHPTHRIGIYSNEVSEYLEGLPGREVTVEFEVVRDFGRFRSYRTVKIGTLDHWRAAGGYTGRQGSPASTPWQ